MTEHPHKGVRDGHRFVCSDADCSTTFTADDMSRVFRQAARHWNKEHGDRLERSNLERLETVECGGHHLHGNAYEVRKYGVFLTAFDVAERLGQIDGYLAAGNAACPECYCYIPDRDKRIEADPDDPFDDEWQCSTCRDEERIDQRASENHSIGGWSDA